MAERKAVSLEGLKREIGDEVKARDVFERIGKLGGFGMPGNYEGGGEFDLSALSDSQMSQIEKLISSAIPAEEKPEEKEVKKEGKK